MKRIIGTVLGLSLLASGGAFAAPVGHDDHDDHGPRPEQHQGKDHKDHRDDRGRHDDHGPRHQRGQRLAKGHWGDRVPDYKHHGLKPPPKGHEWRRVDGDYVLVAVATGIIASVIANH